MNGQRILKNFIYKSLIDILKIIIPIITIPYVYRIFSPEIMGKIEFSLSITSYFFIFVGFGVGKYGLREISKARDNLDERNKIFSELFIIVFFSVFFSFLFYIIYIYIYFNDDILMKKMLLICSLQILSYFSFVEWVNEALENYRFISLKGIFVKIFNLIAILVFIKKAEDYNNYLFIIGFFIFLNNIMSYVYIIHIHKYAKITFKNLKIKQHLFSLFTIVCISNASIFYTQLDKIMLGFYSKDIKEVAYYGMSQRIMSILIVIVTSLISVSMPRLSYYLGNNSKENYKSLLESLFPYIYMLLFPIVIGIIATSDEITFILAGKGYAEAKITLIIFSIRLLVITTENIISNQILFLHRKEKVIVSLLLVFGVFNFILKVILIHSKLYTSETAIISTLIVEIFLVIVEYYYIKNYLKINFKIFNINYLVYLLSSLSFFAIKVLLPKGSFNIYFYYLIIMVSSIFIYLISLIILKDKYILKILLKLKEKFLK
ncbi:oligosaccharide flippase family protein [Fusobacterium canifelinum]|uniref:Lipopolysaccharide biosynthesis protein n=1 Tax=Fusobacterium canifelinum TaxID=285729 RepID=A0A3P1V3C7_9FUSO|nr:lipopolysaccharide biosynthesis protein [Fusobacterium canifelinum]RRD27103.1 lipopolysaccharide biosynthesis protein [Fusobacterium canifelinum]